MSFAPEIRAATHLLTMVEDGSHSISSMRAAFDDADPALIYLIFAWLRAHYRSHSAAEGVLGRIVELCGASRTIVQKLKAGEADPVVAWFEETHDYSALSRDEFITLIVEKLEG